MGRLDEFPRTKRLRSGFSRQALGVGVPGVCNACLISPWFAEFDLVGDAVVRRDYDDWRREHVVQGVRRGQECEHLDWS